MVLAVAITPLFVTHFGIDPLMSPSVRYVPNVFFSLILFKIQPPI